MSISLDQSRRLTSPARPSTVSSFRPPEDRGMELGASYVSSRRASPKAWRRGGGEIDFERTASLQPEPKPAFDSDKDLARLDRGAYADAPTYFQRGYPMRQRRREREVGGDMMFKAKTEKERIAEEVAAQNNHGPEKFQPRIAAPNWRDVKPRRWVGPPMTPIGRSRNDPVDLLTRSMTGSVAPRSLLRDEPWQGGSGAQLGRTRDKKREVSKKEFQTLIRPEPLRVSFREPEDPMLESLRTYSQSLRRPPSMMTARVGGASPPASVLSGDIGRVSRGNSLHDQAIKELL